MKNTGRIRVGIGGWSYEPWRETFYPPEIGKKNELEYASSKVTAIEINSTFYRLQKAEVFAKWRDSTPEDFMFSVKAPRFVAQRRVLAEAGPHITRFLESGVTELGSKLGPILWQLEPKHSFAADDLQAFLELLPSTVDGRRVRHALEVRHASFADPDFLQLARARNVTVVLEDDETYPGFADATGDFVYARLRRSVSNEATGYPMAQIDRWSQRAQAWARGEEPDDLPRVEKLPAEAEAHATRRFHLFHQWGEGTGAGGGDGAARQGLIDEMAAGHRDGLRQEGLRQGRPLAGRTSSGRIRSESGLRSLPAKPSCQRPSCRRAVPHLSLRRNPQVPDIGRQIPLGDNNPIAP